MSRAVHRCTDKACLELTWDRVDFDRGLVLYPPASERSRKKTAIVPMNGPLRSQLETTLALAQTDFVIEHNGKPVQSIKTGFRAAVRRAGIERCAPHALKHTAATWMVQDEIGLEKIARYLGTTKNVVERVYGHHAPDYLADASKALEL